jgi:hypothetical protein
MVKKDNFVPVQDLAGNYIDVPIQSENITMEIKEIKKRGRPKKYSTAEEARKAKIANTIASAKKRKGKQGKGVFLDHIKSIFTGTAEPSEYVIFVLAKVALFLLHKKSKKILKERYGIEGTWFPILKLLAEGTREAYSRAIGQGGANVIRNLGQVVVDNTDLQDDLEQQVEGSGLFSDFNKKIKGAVQAVSNTATSVVNKVKDTATAVVYGRDDYPPKVRDTISKYGDKVITGITLGRTPLGKPLMTALQVASGNTFSQKLENTPYDKLFHLFMCIEFANGKIVLEKNEVINTENSCKIPKDTETKNITSSDIPTGLTLIDALNKTKERMGGKFFTYSAKDNNCQDFIVAFLTANNIGTETDKSWVKQETKVLFEGNDRLRKIANTLTDIGARFDVVRQGAGVIDFEDMKWGSFSKQLQAYNSQHNKKLDLHNFAMMILANPDKFQERTKKRARFYINVILKKGGYIYGNLPYNATWNNYFGNDPDKLFNANLQNMELVGRWNEEQKKKKKQEDSIYGYGNAQSGVAGEQPVGIITGLPVDIILEHLTDEDITRLFGGLFNEGSAVNPNLIYTLGNRRFQLDDEQYARMRLRVANLRKKLQDAPKQTGRKRLDKDPDGKGGRKGINLFGTGGKQSKVAPSNLTKKVAPEPKIEEEDDELTKEYIRRSNQKVNQRKENRLMASEDKPNPLETLRGVLEKTIKSKKELSKIGDGIKKSPVNNIGMANKWIEYVKAYAKKNNMKYNEALKDPKCKAGYKSGEGVFDVLKSVGKAVAPVAIDLASQYAKKKISGSGMPTSRDEYISQLYDQANLGANGKVRLN